MVSGIETFKRWFEGYSTRSVIIGGTASISYTLNMAHQNVRPTT